MSKEKVFETEWLGRKLTFKTGKLVLQANAAVTVQYGETVVMATVVESPHDTPNDWFPLSVDFEERLYAAGIIKGSRWIKREGRPTDASILSGRMIDRSIRPLFDDTSRKPIQVILTVLAVDKENNHDIVGLVAASAALSISGVKWEGPIAGVRVGRTDGKIIVNPTYAEQEESDLDLIVAGTPEKIIMIEAGAKEVKEADMFEAVLEGQIGLKSAFDLIVKMKEELAPAPKEDNGYDLRTEEEKEAEKEKERVFEMTQTWLEKNVKEYIFKEEFYTTKGERKAAVVKIKKELAKYLFDEGVAKDLSAKAIKMLTEKQVDIEITKALVDDKKRVDGRKLDQIRLLTSEVGLLPQVHGSGLFSRGETQIMSVVTLGSAGLEQTLEDLEGEKKKSYMHHYNFAPYSVGETGFMRGPGRREIGHGALAEKALMPVLPSKEDFPYTIRVVSETLGSNGSSSMGSTCGSTLALMDAGVPIKKHVAGIAMGLASTPDLEKWTVLTDIQDLEDGLGGMDFKVTGTRDGITAIQLDTKTLGIHKEIMDVVFKQVRQALDQIIDVMEAEIPAPREELSKHAPRITSFKIDTDKIREVIGAGGKVINKIIEEFEVSIDIDDDGLVMVCGTDAEKSTQAVKTIKDIVREFEAGETFTGKVARILDFGAFVELLPGRDGMVHVSELAPYHVSNPSDFLSEGQVVTVRIKEIDDKGRVNLTMKGLKENEALWKDEKGKSQGGGFGGNKRFDSRGGGRPQRGGDRRGGRR